MTRGLLAFAVAATEICCFAREAHLHARVIDPSKAPVAQAAIIIFDLSGKVVFTGPTDSVGNFAAVLIPGAYQLQTHKEGFGDKNTS